MELPIGSELPTIVSSTGTPAEKLMVYVPLLWSSTVQAVVAAPDAFASTRLPPTVSLLPYLSNATSSRLHAALIVGVGALLGSDNLQRWTDLGSLGTYAAGRTVN